MIPLKGCDDDDDDDENDENEQKHQLEEMRTSFRTKNRCPSVPRSLLLTTASRGDSLVVLRASGQADSENSFDLKSMHKQELLKDNMMCLQMALQATSLRQRNGLRPRPAADAKVRQHHDSTNTADAVGEDEQMSDFDHTDYEDELDGDDDDAEDEELPARLCDILLRSTYQSVASGASAVRVGEDGLPVDSSPLSSCQIRDFYRRYGGL
jgi:hypothetical protein